MQSYAYQHRQGVKEISWEEFARLSAQLTEELAKQSIELIVGIARAGLFAATAVSCSLRRELYPVRVTRRVNDNITYKYPVWKVDVSPEVSGNVVAVIDEIADTGETLALVVQRVKELGAKQVITASLVSHSWANPFPDVIPLITDALVVFPWDRQVYMDGRWQPHTELAKALTFQRS